MHRKRRDVTKYETVSNLTSCPGVGHASRIWEATPWGGDQSFQVSSGAKLVYFVGAREAMVCVFGARINFCLWDSSFDH